MNILYIVSRPLEFNSSASQRNATIVNALSLLGHQITLITAEPSKEHSSYMPISIEPNIQRKYVPLNALKSASGKFERFSFLKGIKSLVYKVYNKRSLYDSWRGIVESKVWNELNCSDFDLLITSSDPKSSHLIGEKLTKKFKLPWIQIWGDPFSNDITSAGVNEQKKQIEEERLFEEADKVAFLSEMTYEDMKQKYPRLAIRFQFMPRPYIHEKIYPLLKTPVDHLNLSYCGDYNSSVRNILPLYRAVDQGCDSLIICGNSDLTLKSTERIHISSRVSESKVTQIEDNADVLVLLCNLAGGQIPGKIYNYSATNKPILFILDGNKEKIKAHFEKKRKYNFCNNNVEDIQQALNEIRNGIDSAHLVPVREFSMQYVINDLLSER